MALTYYFAAIIGTRPYPLDLFTKELPSLDVYQQANMLYWIAKCVFDTPTSQYTLEERKSYREQFLMLCNGLDEEKSSIWFQLLTRELAELYDCGDLPVMRNLILTNLCTNGFDQPIPIREEWYSVSI